MSRTPLSARHSTGPSTAAERALAPDLGRGLMLALVAVANAMIYLVDRPYGYRQHIVEDGVLNHLVSTGVVTLVDGRAFPLFAFLFGYGIVQLSHRQQARGTTEPGVRRLLRRRHLGMIALGALHGVLLFPGDILGLYGVLGLVVTVLLSRSDRMLLTLAGLWLLLASAATAVVNVQQPTDGRGFFWSFESPDLVQATGLRAVEWLMVPFGMLPVATGILVGLVAARHRILDEPQAHRRLLRGTAVAGLGLGVAGGLPSGLVVGGFLSVPDLPGAWALAFLHALTGVAGGLGMAAVFGLVSARARAATGPGRFVGALVATGRRSLSAYLFQSVLFVLLLTLPFGGLGAHLGSAAAAALALGVWATSVLGSAALERRSVPGPAEVLLRRWTYAMREGWSRGR